MDLADRKAEHYERYKKNGLDTNYRLSMLFWEWSKCPSRYKSQLQKYITKLDRLGVAVSTLLLQITN